MHVAMAEMRCDDITTMWLPDGRFKKDVGVGLNLVAFDDVLAVDRSNTLNDALHVHAAAGRRSWRRPVSHRRPFPSGSVPLPADEDERRGHLRLARLFMVWKAATGFVLISETKSPDALSATLVTRDEVTVRLAGASRLALRAI